MSIPYVNGVDIESFVAYLSPKRLSCVQKSQKVKIVKVVTERHIPLTEKTCPVCEKRFMGAKLAKFCSQACKLKASYQRHAEARRAERRERYRASKTK
jgi:hypothetical protein